MGKQIMQQSISDFFQSYLSFAWMAALVCVAIAQVALSQSSAASVSLQQQLTYSASQTNPAPTISFEVATIRPNRSGAPMMQKIDERGRYFTTVNTSLDDLIQFAYDVQAKQIIGGPPWIDKDRFDVSATSSQDSKPSLKEVRAMLQKLLTERFNLAIHWDKRELPAFVLTAEGKPKLIPTKLSGTVPVNHLFAAHSGWTITMQNATTSDFSGYLQMIVLNRPVVDATGISGKFDLSVTFLPDESEFNGHPPLTGPVEDNDVAPSLLNAIREQLGLKLEAKKAMVNALIVEHVEKPSEN